MTTDHDEYVSYEIVIEAQLDRLHVKVHPHAAIAVGGNQDMWRTKGAQYTWNVKHE